MRLDFNQHGSWRKGPDFDQRIGHLVQDVAARLADLVGSRLRIVGEAGEVECYRDVGGKWRKAGKATA